MIASCRFEVMCMVGYVDVEMIISRCKRMATLQRSEIRERIENVQGPTRCAS